MREIKFRAWDKNNKRMIYDYPDSMLMGEMNKFCRAFNSQTYETMQYTGLKDKNGVPIYEGDVVRVDDGTDNNNAYKVVWGEFEDCCFSGETWVLEDFGYQPTIHYRHEDCEVIGNIYENPELIEGDNDQAKTNVD